MAEDLQPTPAEQKLIDAAAKGETADYQVGDKQADNPANGAEWGEERTLRAEILYDLCTGARREWKVHAKGVQAVGARITGSLDFQGAEINAPLLLGFCRFDQPLILRNARIRTLNLSGSHCQGMRADGLAARGDVFLRDGFTAEGEVRLLGADIGGDLSCRAAEFKNSSGFALNAQNMKVVGALFLDRIKLGREGGFNLNHAKVAQLLDDVNSWPGPGQLILDGFDYEAIAGDAPTTAEARLRWLRLQPTKPFKPQPYEQLIRVLRRMGHERDAREIAIAKQDALRKSGELGWWSSVWRLFLGVTIGYGYKPWKAFIFMAVFLILGMAVFYGAGFRGLMMPTQAKAGGVTPDMECATSYPCFHPFMYSVDTFIPIIDFHQQRYWLPDTSRPGGWGYRLYLWVHIALGWLLSTVAVVGFSGIIKKD